MNKDVALIQATERLNAVFEKALERLQTEVLDPLADVGSPEKVIGKKYEDWTPEDMQKAVMVWGTGAGTPLDNLVFKKKVAELDALREEVR